jgi:hypothetical protein
MSESRRLDGSQARLLEVLTGIADDLRAAASYVEAILDADPNTDLDPLWTAALVRYGRCFGKGVSPWGAGETVGSLSEVLQVRQKHFRRLRDTLVSHPGGVDQTYLTEAVLGAQGRLQVECTPVPMFSLGRLEAMDFAELLTALQVLVDRRRVEVENDLHAQLAEMSEAEFRELPQAGYGKDDIQASIASDRRSDFVPTLRWPGTMKRRPE